MRADSDIKRDVEEELKWEPNVDATDIAVAVKNGVVTLTGFVRSYAHKLAAERAAKRVAGVVGLANDLEVRLPGVDERPDPEIAREVAAELKIWLPDSSQHIKPVVKNGWVTLEGEVEWNYQRDYAERAIRWIKGVKGVSNLIRLRPQVALSPRGDQAQNRGGVPAQRPGRRQPCHGRDERRRGDAQRHRAILGGAGRGGTSRLAGTRRHQSGKPNRSKPLAP